MANIIGLDLGTTTVTGVLLDMDRRNVLSLIQRRNDAAIVQRLPTRAEQDPHRLLVVTLDVLRELASSGEAVDGVAVTGQMHGLLCVDAQGSPLSPLISWQDRRTAELLPDGTSTLERMQSRLVDLAWQENGCRIAHGYGAAILFWMQQRGKLEPGTRRVCTIADWVVGQLMGCLPVTDPTLAASWGIYHILDGVWNADYLERLGLDAALLPPVRPSGEKLGEMADHVAANLGLADGISVYNALGDNQASFLGSVEDAHAAVLFNLGTGGQICWVVSSFESPSEGVEIRPLIPGSFLRVGASLCGGSAYAWLNCTVQAWLAEFGMDLDENSIYERLNLLAAACTDMSGVSVQPTFLGARGNPEIAGAKIDGLTLDKLDLGILARATLVGMVDELRALYVGCGGLQARHTHLVATGGGVRKNPLMPGLIEQRFGLPVQVPCQKELAVLGAVVLPMLKNHLC